MRVSARTLAAAILALIAACPSTISAETAEGRVRGAVTDDTGGVLPGVTVVATFASGQVVATTVTDEKGAYVFGALPAGPVHLTFQLEGFSTAVVPLTVRPGAETLVLERLSLAPITETVDVWAKAPVDRPPPPPPPPPPVLRPVPRHDPTSICGPAKPSPTPESFGTIRSRRHEAEPGPHTKGAERGLYTKGDELVIDGGTLNGIEVGRNLVARRYYRVNGPAGAAATGEHTSGLLQIVTADERVSTAVVVYACDEIMSGDFLGTFQPEPMRTPAPGGVPAYHDAARILFGDAGQMLGVPRRLLVIDHGTERGIQVGQRLTLFRRQDRAPDKPSVVGDAVVVAVRTDSATIRVEKATDAILFGDWAAPQRPSPAVSSVATNAAWP